ncbi:MAG: hypothetical protein AMXMBFR13_14270 [Phycisphaerae bacterium]
MPRVYCTKPEYESRLIRGFLRHRGYRILRASWQDKPDAVLTVIKGRRTVRIAIEHTDYYSDAPAGQASETAQLDEFWTAVQRSITHRIVRRTPLRSTHVTVHFSSAPNLPGCRRRTAYSELARRFAAELVEFVLQSPSQPDFHICYRSHGPGRIPAQYELLGTYLDWVRIYRASGLAWTVARMSWNCTNVTTGCVGLRKSHIISAVKAKNRKATEYDWKDVQEKWLLITASGKTVANVAAPRLQKTNWTDEEISSMSEQSPFDRVFFWDAVHRHTLAIPLRGHNRVQPASGAE